jgi:hypothetical protein
MIGGACEVPYRTGPWQALPRGKSLRCSWRLKAAQIADEWVTPRSRAECFSSRVLFVVLQKFKAQLRVARLASRYRATRASEACAGSISGARRKANLPRPRSRFHNPHAR